MKRLITTLGISSSLMVAVGAVAPSPLKAASIGEIEFFSSTNPPNYQTYSGTNSGSFIPHDEIAAVTALTDNVAGSNVELWYTNENPTEYVGFSGTLNGHQVRISNITLADWSNTINGKTLAEKWVEDLLAVYEPLGFSLSEAQKAQGIAELESNGMDRGHDPNIDYVIGEDGLLKLGLIGHFDLTPLVQSGEYVIGNTVLDAILQNAAMVAAMDENLFMQVSEVARVEIDGEVFYAYGFNATETGITTLAVDGTNGYTGLYQWSVPLQTETVPEPSLLLGLIGLGGLLLGKKCLNRRK